MSSSFESRLSCNACQRNPTYVTDVHPPLTTHHSPLTIHHLPLTTHHSPLTTHHSPLTTHHSPLTIHHSPLTTHPSPLTTHHSPLTIHPSPSRPSPTNFSWRSNDLSRIVPVRPMPSQPPRCRQQPPSRPGWWPFGEICRYRQGP